MNKLTLLQSHSIIQSMIEAETLEEALKLKPNWMYPLPNTRHLWIFRGENSGDSTLLQTSQFAECLSEDVGKVTSRLRELPAEIIKKYLDDKHAQMRRM